MIIRSISAGRRGDAGAGYAGVAQPLAALTL